MMNFARNFFFILVVFPISVFATEEKKFEAKVTVIDVESILEHSLAVQHIKKSINLISDQIQNEISDKEIKLKQVEANLIKESGVLNGEEFERKVSIFNKKVSKIQQEMQKKRNALEQAHVAAIFEVHNNTIAVISDLSKKHGFNIVFPSTQVLYVENDLNITLEVITELNERLKKVEVKYGPDKAK